jgi:hypothetical protein
MFVDSPSTSSPKPIHESRTSVIHVFPSKVCKQCNSANCVCCEGRSGQFDCAENFNHNTDREDAHLKLTTNRLKTDTLVTHQKECISDKHSNEKPDNIKVTRKTSHDEDTVAKHTKECLSERHSNEKPDNAKTTETSQSDSSQVSSDKNCDNGFASYKANTENSADSNIDYCREQEEITTFQSKREQNIEKHVTFRKKHTSSGLNNADDNDTDDSDQSCNMHDVLLTTPKRKGLLNVTDKNSFNKHNSVAPTPHRPQTMSETKGGNKRRRESFQESLV